MQKLELINQELKDSITELTKNLNKINVITLKDFLFLYGNITNFSLSKSLNSSASYTKTIQLLDEVFIFKAIDVFTSEEAEIDIKLNGAQIYSNGVLEQKALSDFFGYNKFPKGAKIDITITNVSNSPNNIILNLAYYSIKENTLNNYKSKY